MRLLIFILNLNQDLKIPCCIKVKSKYERNSLLLEQLAGQTERQIQICLLYIILSEKLDFDVNVYDDFIKKHQNGEPVAGILGKILNVK